MTELLDEGRATKSQQDSDSLSEPADALEDIEAAAAEATAVAARARARADRLRRQAGDGDGDGATLADTAPAPPAIAVSRRRRRWPGLICITVAVLLISAAGAVSGDIVWQHRAAVCDRQLSAEFVAAARQAVVTLMTMNFQTAKQDVQRVVDESTGEFHDDFAKNADDFIKVVQDSKVVTTAQVTQAAVQSKTGDSATVLVAANSKVTNSTGAQQDPRSWRLIVTLARDSGQVKISKLEFIP